MWITLLAVFIGGGLGSLSRYGVSLAVSQQWKIAFPLGTLLANILSCIILAVLVGFFKDKMENSFWGYFLLIGFCGGFSTFSTFSLETFQLFREGQPLWAAVNVFGSVAICFFIMYTLIKEA